VLKKAGIIVAASTAGVLAFSPLAFAGDTSHANDSKDDKSHSKVDHKDDGDKHDDGDHMDDGDKHDDGDDGHDDDGNDGNDDDGNGGGGNGGGGGEDNGTSEGNLANECEFGNESGDVEQGLFGGSSLLGVADTLVGTATNAATQLNTLNCNNVNVTDVIDVDSNNDTSSVERTFVEESFND
jgi:hypothetical protein